ncbi:hypothetical protein Aduo_015446 [Ancylostoma duodenale]
MLPNCQLSCRNCITDSVPSKPSTQTSRDFKGTDSVATKPSRTLESCRDNGMTKEQRQKFLDMHNNYRSMAAKGQAKDA